jgi:pimeloyl-ACP methyl ester carboxylesterase
VRPRAKLIIDIAPDAILALLTKSDRPIHRLLRLLNNGSLPDQPLLDLCVAGLRTFRCKQPPPRRLTDAELRSIHTPTLILFGARSPLTDAARASRRVRNLIANVESEICEGAGHMLPVEKPEIFNRRLLRFIDVVDGAARP